MTKTPCCPAARTVFLVQFYFQTTAVLHHSQVQAPDPWGCHLSWSLLQAGDCMYPCSGFFTTDVLKVSPSLFPYMTLADPFPLGPENCIF